MLTTKLSDEDCIQILIRSGFKVKDLEPCNCFQHDRVFLIGTGIEDAVICRSKNLWMILDEYIKGGWIQVGTMVEIAENKPTIYDGAEAKKLYAWTAGAYCFGHKFGCECLADSGAYSDFCLTTIVYTEEETGADFDLNCFLRQQGATEYEIAESIYEKAELIERVPHLDLVKKLD